MQQEVNRMDRETKETSLISDSSKIFSIKNMLHDSIKQNVRQYTMVIALLSIWLIFMLLTKGTFLTTRNLSNLFLQCATVAILASGMVMVIVAGHIDLSVGSVAGFTGAIIAVLQVKMHLDTIPSILITLLVGLMIGCWHGFWIAYRGVPAFIVTLSSMMLFRGGIFAITQGFTIGPMNESFRPIGQGYLPKLFFIDAKFNDTSAFLAILFIIILIILELRKRASRIRYGFDTIPMNLLILKIIGISIMIAAVFSIMIFYMGIPYAILIVIGVVILFTFITNNTVFGRQIYAIGGNKEAARLSGINIVQRTVLIFIIMGLLATIAGMVFTSRLNSAAPAAGNLFELDAIAAAIIGGTSTMGGEGTIFGAIIGALVMASLDNGMSLMNLDISYQYMIKGLILLLAVWVDIASRKK